MIHSAYAEHDSVAAPAHYFPPVLGGTECIEYTRLMTFDVGNAFKYVARFEGKNGFEDLRKALTYLQDAEKYKIPATFSDSHRVVLKSKYRNHIHPTLSQFPKVYMALGLIIDGQLGHAAGVIASYLHEHGELDAA